MFSEKLNFIMNITRTQASALGRACNLDPSYISRLRNGTRPLPKNPDYFGKMTGYLAGRVVTDYQKTALCDAMKISSYPTDSRLAEELIGKWLAAEKETSPDISVILESFSGTKPAKSPAAGSSASLPEAKSFYYGSEGKREAVLQFFDMILKEKRPQTLLLSSEEDMSWLQEDPVFSVKWVEEFTKVLMAETA